MQIIPSMLHLWRIFLTYRVLLYVGILYVHPLHIYVVLNRIHIPPPKKKTSISLEVEGNNTS